MADGEKIKNTDRYSVLLDEWHSIKNGSLTLDDFLPGSEKKVWWVCEKSMSGRQALQAALRELDARIVPIGKYCLDIMTCKQRIMNWRRNGMQKETRVWHLIR